MKKYRMLLVMVALVLIAGITTGCDNRSQMEKDADKAYSDAKKTLK